MTTSNEPVLTQQSTTERVGQLETKTTQTIYGSSFNYQAEAVLTKSNVFHGNLVPLQKFKDILQLAISAGNALDIAKKALFYGTGAEKIHVVPGEETLEGLPFLFPDPTTAIDIIHAIIGKATESTELLQLLDSVMSGTKVFDPVNFKEELADGQWYDAIGAEAIKTTFDEIQRLNIAKLRRRYGDKFTEYDAINRNLDAERKILES